MNTLDNMPSKREVYVLMRMHMHMQSMVDCMVYLYAVVWCMV